MPIRLRGALLASLRRNRLRFAGGYAQAITASYQLRRVVAASKAVPANSQALLAS